MKKKTLFTRALLLFTLWLLLSLLIGSLASNIISRQEYDYLSHIISNLSITDPDTIDTIIQSLKTPPTDPSVGLMILTKYNYTPDTYVSTNLFHLTAVMMASLSFPFLLVLFLLYRQYVKNNKRIDELTTYLEEVNAGETVILKPQEDQYSILEDQIYKTVTQLRETREAAQKERNSLAENLADISHQLKTPITSMSLMAQLLADDCSEENSIYIERLLRQLSRLEKLVASLLTLSKLDAGTLTLEKVPVDVISLLLRSVEPIDQMIHQKKQTLLYENDQYVSFTGDLTWTAEAILNILKNCSEHTPEGGSIRIAYSENPLYTELMITDTGNGFEKEELEKIFKRYYKGKSAAKDSVGIGLALSKAIIEKQKGVIRAENAPEGGARFIIHFYK